MVGDSSRWHDAKALTPVAGGLDAPASLAIARALRTDARPATNIVVAVDSRIELFSLLMGLAGAPEYRQSYATCYRKAAAQQFPKWADHPAVATTHALRRGRYISFDAPVSLAVHLDSETLEPLRPLSPRPEGLEGRWEGFAFGHYLDSVRDFARRSGFREFFAAQRRYLDAVEERIRVALARHDVVGWLQSFFGGDPGAGFVVVPGILTGINNYGASLFDLEGRETHYQVIQLEQPDSDGLPVPGSATIALIAHEMAHAFVNRIVRRRSAEFEPVGRQLYKLVIESMAAGRYAWWRTLIEESVVRAATLLLVKTEIGDDVALELIRGDELAGFVWIPELADDLERLRAVREERGLEAIAPNIADFFARLCARYTRVGVPAPRFRGPIGWLMGEERIADLIVVAPPDGPLGEFVDLVCKHLPKNTPRLSTPARWSDIGARLPMLYGAPRDNQLIRQALASAGATIEEDRIVLGDRVFEGAHLMLICARPHPYDPNRGVLLYTAYDEVDLVGVNRLRHGATDWVVGQQDATGPRLVARGDFSKSWDGEWLAQLTTVLAP